MELGRGAMTNVRAIHQLFLLVYLIPVLLDPILLFCPHSVERLNAVNGDMERGDVPTRSGSQLFHSAQERITSKNPAASTKASRMTAAG